MNQKQDYIKLLEFGKDVTENMKWKGGNLEITTFFNQLYSQQNFEKAINIIKKDDDTSRNIIGAIQKIEGLIFSGNYKPTIQFLIKQLNNKQLRDSDVLKALENWLRRELRESNDLKPFKFKGGRSKKHKKRGTKKTRKNIKRGGLPSFLNPFNILRNRKINAVVPINTNTDPNEIDLGLEEDPVNVPYADQVEIVSQPELEEYRIPPELNDFSNIFFFNTETGNYEFTPNGNRVFHHNNNNIATYRQLVTELNSKKLNCESNLKTGFKITRWTLIICGILIGTTSTALMPMGLLGVFSIGLLFAALFGLPISSAIISGAILSVEDYIIDKYCISSANKRNAKSERYLQERRRQFENPQEVQTGEGDVEADAFYDTPEYIPDSDVKIGVEGEEEKEGEDEKEDEKEDDTNSFPPNKFIPLKNLPKLPVTAESLYHNIRVLKRDTNYNPHNNENPDNNRNEYSVLTHEKIKPLIEQEKRRKQSKKNKP